MRVSSSVRPSSSLPHCTYMYKPDGGIDVERGQWIGGYCSRSLAWGPRCGRTATYARKASSSSASASTDGDGDDVVDDEGPNRRGPITRRSVPRPGWRGNRHGKQGEKKAVGA
jgi:hypothetical protein